MESLIRILLSEEREVGSEEEKEGGGGRGGEGGGRSVKDVNHIWFTGDMGHTCNVI